MKEQNSPFLYLWLFFFYSQVGFLSFFENTVKPLDFGR